MNSDVFKAILAMDSYNRGYNASITLSSIPGAQIGTASTLLNSSVLGAGVDQSSGFYGVAYSYNGATIISYRGTDDPLGANSGSDISNGWILGAGNYNATQGTRAVEFYKAVAEHIDGVNVDLQTVSISLTGHSLGGGLAGYIGALYGQDAEIYDSMDYLDAATSAHFYASLDPFDPQYSTLAEPLIDLIYDGNSPWAIDASGVGAQHIYGEALDNDFIRQVPSQAYDLGENITFSDVDAVERHSMATLVIRMFADDQNEVSSDEWKTAAHYFWPVMYDDEFAGVIGASFVGGTLSTQGKFSDILRQVIAYSAIDEGTRIFGDTAIRAFYDDANNIGAALLDANVSQNIVAHATDISKSFIQFSGQLALSKTLQTEIADAVDGVLTYTDETDNHTLRIDLTDETWLPVSDYVPNIQPEALAGIARTTITHPILEASGDEVAIRGAIEKITGENSTDHIENVVFAVSNSGTSNISLVPTAMDKVTLFVGGDGNDTVNAGSDNLLIWGVDGDDTLNGSAANDYLFGGAGNDTLNGGEGANILVGGDGNDILYGGTAQDILIGGAGNDKFYGGFDARESAPTTWTENQSYPDIFWGGEGADEFYFSSYNNALILEGKYFSESDIINFDLSSINPDYIPVSGLDGSYYDAIIINPDADDRIYIDGIKAEITGIHSRPSYYIDGVAAGDYFAHQITTIEGPHDLTFSEHQGGASFDIYGGGRYGSLIFTANPSLTSNPLEYDKYVQIDNFVNNDLGLYFVYAGDTEVRYYKYNDQHLSITREIDFIGSDVDFKGTNGNDNLIGTGADEILYGGAGNDVLVGGGGDDTLDGAIGEDTVSYYYESSGVYADLLNSTASDGEGGTDTLVDVENVTGSSYGDTLIGDDGSNVIEGGGGDDAIDGNGGSDTVSYKISASAVTVNLSTGTASDGDGGTDTIFNIENIRGSNYTDTLIGNSSDNVIEGGSGNDSIDGGSGSDTASYRHAVAAISASLTIGSVTGDGVDTLAGIENLEGSAFNDTLIGDENDNILIGGAGDDALDGGAGSDTVSYKTASYAVTVDLSIGTADDGDGGTDTLANIENVAGSAFDDVLIGDAGDNIFIGGYGNDNIDGESGSDTISYEDSLDSVEINLSSGAYQFIDDSYDVFTSIENARGTDFDDVILGNAEANILQGGNGNDFLNGGGGSDHLDGGSGVDTAAYNSWGISSAVTVNLALGTALGGAGNDTLVSIENIVGSNYNDTLVGDSGDNIINGGGGNDTLDGGAGNDTISFESDAVYSGITVNLLSGTSSGDDVGNDTLTNFENIIGGISHDTLIGNSENNIIDGSTGNDVLDGGAGDDILNGGGFVGFDEYDLSEFYGSDTASYASAANAVTVDLNISTSQNTGYGWDTLISIENVTGSNYADTISGDGNLNVLTGC